MLDYFSTIMIKFLAFGLYRFKWIFIRDFAEEGKGYQTGGGLTPRLS